MLKGNEMIIVRSPLRITLGGGGTDLPSYANNYEGFCISATISKYSYVAINHSFFEGINLKYSKDENVHSVGYIEHPVFREALKWIRLKTPQIEIVSVADVPSNGAGLGNSGAFTVALLKALCGYKNIPYSQEQIAELACDINMVRLGKTQGKQDEYASAIGGINAFTFKRDGSVGYRHLKIEHDTLVELEENLMLFYTGVAHDTESILKYQEKLTKEEPDMVSSLHLVKDQGLISETCLEQGNLNSFAKSLNEQWALKEARMPEGSAYLRNVHDETLKNGSLGTKIVGSGNGGFFMCYANDKAKLRKYFKEQGMGELRFSFDFEGVKRMV